MSPPQDLEPAPAILESLASERRRTHARDGLVVLSHPLEQTPCVVGPEQRKPVLPGLPMDQDHVVGRLLSV